LEAQNIQICLKEIVRLVGVRVACTSKEIHKKFYLRVGYILIASETVILKYNGNGQGSVYGAAVSLARPPHITAENPTRTSVNFLLQKTPKSWTWKTMVLIVPKIK
jgi:hypothetical protein